VALKSNSATGSNEAPWWWFDAGSEVCGSCDQSYAYQTGSYCLDCDSNICPLCVQENEDRQPVCPGCA
jgi:hypothetical protein